MALLDMIENIQHKATNCYIVIFCQLLVTGSLQIYNSVSLSVPAFSTLDRNNKLSPIIMKPCEQIGLAGRDNKRASFWLAWGGATYSLMALGHIKTTTQQQWFVK